MGGQQGFKSIINGSPTLYDMNTWLCGSERRAKLIETESMNIVGTDELLKLYAKMAGQSDPLLGAGRGLTVECGLKWLIDEANSINSSDLGFIRDSYGRLWALDTMWTIIYILRYGKSVALDHVEFYICDLTNDTLIDFRGTYRTKEVGEQEKIFKEYEQAKKLISNGLRPISITYTVGDLMKRLLAYDLRGMWSYSNYYCKIIKEEDD